MQVELLAFRPSPGEPVVEVAPLTIDALDYRQEREAGAALAALLAEGDAVVFGEGELAPAAPGQNRLRLEPARTLVFWTTPASPAEVRAALAAARPERVASFAVDPGLDKPDAFLRRLSGLVKHTLNNRMGRVTLAELAAATGAARNGGAAGAAVAGKHREHSRSGAGGWRAADRPGKRQTGGARRARTWLRRGCGPRWRSRLRSGHISDAPRRTLYCEGISRN